MNTLEFINNLTDARIAAHAMMGPHSYSYNEAKFETLKNTRSPEEIEEAVYSSDLYDNQCIVRNSNLTEEQCGHLTKRLDIDDDLSWFFLLTQKNFPQDLLLQVAMRPLGPMAQAIVLGNPNATPEIKVAITLNKMGKS